MAGTYLNTYGSYLVTFIEETPMSITEEDAESILQAGRAAAGVLVGMCDIQGSSGCRIPVALDGANYVVTVTKLEAPINEE